MHELKIESKVSLNDYIRFLYLLTYRKPGVIIISFTGLILIILPVLYFFDLYTVIDKPPYLPFLSGFLITILFPLYIYLAGRRNFRSNILLQEKIEFTFTMEKVYLKGGSFESSITWDKIYKIRSLRNWLLFYQDKTRLNFMIKNSFSGDQQKEFDRLINLNRLA